MSTFHAQSCRGYREKRWTDGRRKDTRTHTHTHTHTDRPTAITLAAHARRRGLMTPWIQYALNVTTYNLKESAACTQCARANIRGSIRTACDRPTTQVPNITITCFALIWGASGERESRYEAPRATSLLDYDSLPLCVDMLDLVELW